MRRVEAGEEGVRGWLAWVVEVALHDGVVLQSRISGMSAICRGVEVGFRVSSQYHRVEIKFDLRPRRRHHARRVEDKSALADLDPDDA